MATYIEFSFWGRRQPLGFSAFLLLILLSLAALANCQPGKHGHGHGRLRGMRRAQGAAKQGSSLKHLYCKQQGGCSQCQEDEEIERYCADTGFKELLHCTTSEHLQQHWPVVLTYPYPPDVHIDDDREEDEQGGHSTIRVVRSCTEKTVEAHQEALAAEVAAAEQQHGGVQHTPLLNFELGMVLLLGLALPVVYWRKIRIRHL